MDELLQQGRSALGKVAVGGGEGRVDRIRVSHYGHGTPNWRRPGNCRSTGARASLPDVKAGESQVQQGGYSGRIFREGVQAGRGTVS
jgi:hypothetical protein